MRIIVRFLRSIHDREFSDHFPENAEAVPDGPTCKMLSEAAKRNGLFIVGGTIPEVSNRKYYNTCTVWNPAGEMIAKYRKVCFLRLWLVVVVYVF